MKCCGSGRPLRWGTVAGAGEEVAPLMGIDRLITWPVAAVASASSTAAGVSRLRVPR